MFLELNFPDRTFDPKYRAVVSSVEELDTSKPSIPDLESGLAPEPKDSDTTSPPYITSLQPASGWKAIKPWLTPRPYPFLPRPLGWLLVICIPFVLPAALLIIAAFSVERVRSQLRVRQHFRARRSSNIDTTRPGAAPGPDAAVSNHSPLASPRALALREDFGTRHSNDSSASTQLPMLVTLCPVANLASILT